MNNQLRDRIARKTWAMWKEAENPTIHRQACPREFYEMAQLAMEETHKEFRKLIDIVIKERLERMLEE